MDSKYKFWILVLLILAMLPLVHAESLTDYGVSYWTHDDNNISGSTSYDYLKRNNGTITGSVTGFSGKMAETFKITNASSTYIEIANNEGLGLNASDSFSISFWYKKDNDPQGGDSRIFYGTDDAGNHFSPFLYTTSDGKVTFTITQSGVGSSSVTTFNALLNDTWYFVAATYNSSDRNLSLNINNSQDNSVTASYYSTSLPNDQPYNISPTTTRDYIYYVDELAIWNKSLNTTDISDLYNGGDGFNPYASTAVTYFKLTIYDNYTNNTIAANVTINGSTYSTTNGTINTNITHQSGGTVNITINATNYTINEHFSFDVSWNLTSNMTYHKARRNVSAYIDPDNTTLITTFNVTATGGFFGKTTTSYLLVETEWNATENITIDTDNYGTETVSFDGTSSSDYSFYLQIANSFIINFYDERGRWVVNNATIEVEIIAKNYSASYTVTNGSLTISALTPDDYIIRFNTNYSYDRSYYITLIEDSRNTLDLYVLDRTYPNSLNVTATILSTLNEKLEGAEIYVTRFSPNASNYITTERVKTNFEGEARIQVTTDELYRFIVYYENNLVSHTSKSYIYSDEITLVVPIGEDVGEEFYQSLNISINLERNGNIFSYSYLDQYLLSTNNCLKIYRLNSLGGVSLLNSSCNTATSGTITLTVANTTQMDVIAKAYATIGGVEVLLDTVSYGFPDTDRFGNMGVLIVIIITLLFALIGIWNPVIALILTPIPLLFGSIMHIVTISVPVVIALEFVFIIIAFALGRSS